MGFRSKKRAATGMHCCPKCNSNLVQPVSWHELRDGHWNVELRCPDCEWGCRNSYTQHEVDRYEDQIDRGDRALIEDLRALVRANMEEEASRFAEALAADNILPEDFYAGRGSA